MDPVRPDGPTAEPGGPVHPAADCDPASGPDGDYDPGVAAERTQLAWNRSGLAVLVALALIVRHLWPLQGYKSVLALALMAAGGTLWAVGMRQAVGATPAPERVLGESTCRLIMVGTLLLAAAAVVVSAVL